MTFPAWDHFDGDKRVKVRHLRVYRYLRLTLDFRQPRYAPREMVAFKTGEDKANVGRTLTDLVRWGYLFEHPREANGARRFTLCWSAGEGGEILPPPHTAPDAADVA